MNIFANKKALVIGGTSGAGFETAKLLASKGADVTATGRKIPSDPFINFIQLDLESENPQEIFDNHLKQLIENTDILVYAAGPFVQKALDQTTASDWLKMAEINYALPGMCLSCALSNMEKRNFGRIIFFGGTRTDSIHAYKTNAAYAGAKTALSVLVKSAASEYGSYGITCNEILPGFTHNAPENTKTVTEKTLAENAVYLMGNEAFNGVLLNIDRGWQP